jgi:hypothetical protein
VPDSTNNVDALVYSKMLRSGPQCYSAYRPFSREAWEISHKLITAFKNGNLKEVEIFSMQLEAIDEEISSGSV